MTDEFREDEMHALLVGDVFGYGATDAAGMVSDIYLIFLPRKLNVFWHGIDLPDITLVIQYRVPKEPNTFIQRAGCAACDPTYKLQQFCLQSHYILMTRRRRQLRDLQSGNAKKRAADGQLQPSVAQQSCSSLDGSRDRGEAVEVVVPEIAAESCCEPAMDNFLNADRCPEKCRRKVVNSHFGNNDLCKSFSAFILKCSHHHGSFLVPVVYRYCCPRCAPCEPEFCCDLCHPSHIQFPPATDAYQKPRDVHQNSNRSHSPWVTMGCGLQGALIEFRKQLAVERLGRASFLSPQSLLSKTLLDRIVVLAHDHKISTLDSLREQISWGFIDSHGPQIVELVNKHCPLVLSSPFTTAPLQPRSTAMANSSVANSPASGSRPRAKGRCGACGAMDGHNSERFIFYNMILLLLIVFKNGLAKTLGV